MKRHLSAALSKAITSAYPQLPTTTTANVNISKTPNVDYADTSALKLAKSLQSSPLEIATNIISHLPSSPTGLFDTITSTEKGFLNISVGDVWLSRKVRVIADGTTSMPVLNSSPDRVIVDFASPNVGKQLHAGHLRSSVIGDTISRMLEHQGHDVQRLSHVGDVGLPVGLLVAHGLDINIKWMEDDMATLPTPEELSALYVEAKARSKDDVAFHESVLSTLNFLQCGADDDGGGAGDDDGGGAGAGGGGGGGGGGTLLEGDTSSDIFSRRRVSLAWKRVKEASRAEHNELFDRLGVSVSERPESTYTPMLGRVVGELLASNIAELSNGATVVFPSEENKDENEDENKKSKKKKSKKKSEQPPMLVRKSDGSWLYGTIDLAAVRDRLLSERADRIIYVTDEGQRLHFSQVFDVAQRTSWMECKEEEVEVEANSTSRTRSRTGKRRRPTLHHVGFGLVRDETGSKLSSRSGDALPLRSLLDRATNEARLALERTNDYKLTTNDGRTMLLSEAVGTSALRYYDLRAGRKSYALNFEQMLAFKGNTAVYLQYALTRIKSIQRKAAALREEEEERDGVAASSAAPSAAPSAASFAASFAASSAPDSTPPPTMIFPTSVERKLAMELMKFEDIIETSSNTLSPHVLCEYLYVVAKTFHAFYEECPVTGSEHERERLTMLRATENVLGCGCRLLGVVELERM